jgi:hypothetical protein
LEVRSLIYTFGLPNPQLTPSHETLSASRSRDFPRGKILWRKVNFFVGNFQNYETSSRLRSYFFEIFNQNFLKIIFCN